MRLGALTTPRTLGATLGLLAATIAVGFIVTRLVEASRPVPTAVRLVNTLTDPVTVQGLTLSTHSVLTGSLTLPARQGTQAAPEWDSKAVDVAPGLPLAVQLTLADPPRQAACELDPRPQGTCVVRATYQGSTALACDYDCKQAKPQ